MYLSTSHQPPDDALLVAKRLVKRFGGVVAVNDATIWAEAGQVTSLIGPNGAGKTTLFNMITGVYKPTAGDVFFSGAAIGGMRTDRIVSRGIGRTFQNIRLFTGLTVLDNVRLGCHPGLTSGFFRSLLGTAGQRREERQATAECLELLDLVGLKSKVMEIAGNLPYGEQRRLEIARALALKPRLLLLDEPAAGMNPTETADLTGLIARLLAMGLSVFLIEHHMALVMEISHRIHVLDHGEIIASGSPDAVKNDPRVIEAYLGTGSTKSRT